MTAYRYHHHPHPHVTEVEGEWEERRRLYSGETRKVFIGEDECVLDDVFDTEDEALLHGKARLEKELEAALLVVKNAQAVADLVLDKLNTISRKLDPPAKTPDPPVPVPKPRTPRKR